MDLSKLPRLSDTPAPAKPAAAPESAKASAGPRVHCVACGTLTNPGAKFCDACGAAIVAPAAAGAPRAPAIAAEVWISVVVGILLLIIWPTTLEYAAHQVLHTPFAPYPTFDASGDQIYDANKKPIMADYATLTDGAKIPYRQTSPAINPNFWSDLAVTLFAVALILEGVALVLSRKPLVVLFALLVTMAATVFNLGYFLATFRTYGLAPVSAVAIILGGYMTIYQIGLFTTALRFRRASL